MEIFLCPRSCVPASSSRSRLMVLTHTHPAAHAHTRVSQNSRCRSRSPPLKRAPINQCPAARMQASRARPSLEGDVHLATAGAAALHAAPSLARALTINSPRGWSCVLSLLGFTSLPTSSQLSNPQHHCSPYLSTVQPCTIRTKACAPTCSTFVHL